MKSSATEPLIAASQKRDGLRTEIASLISMATEQDLLLARLELSGDITTTEVVAQICQAQTLVGMLPRRIANREQLAGEAEQEHLLACQSFISNHLGLRIRALDKRARAKAHASLAPLIADERALRDAVNSSAMVEKCRTLSLTATLTDAPVGSVSAYAERLLNAWAECDVLDKELA